MALTVPAWRISPRTLGWSVSAMAFVARVAWVRENSFTPDPAMVLWMSLDAVRRHVLPDHGLVSSFAAFQPPGLVWATMPFVAAGSGRPEVVMVAFGGLNAAAIGFFVVTIAERWGVRAAIATGALCVVGPDAFMASSLWHPSLYTGAVALLLTAGIRLRDGSLWWGSLLAALPGLYALIHYSGFALVGPSIVLLALSRRPRRQLGIAIGAGLAVVAVAWVPFLVFEAHRGFADFATILHGVDPHRTLLGKIHERFHGLEFAFRHLGEALSGPVKLTPIVDLLALGSLFFFWGRRRRGTPVVVFAGVIASGLVVQAAANMGERTDVLMLWLLPLYGLAGWILGQIPSKVGIVTATFVLLLIGTFDLRQAVRGVPYSQRLSRQWSVAASAPNIRYSNLFGLNGVYLPCDPPYTWGTEIWYLEDVKVRGEGVRAAVAAHAFRDRRGRCDRRPD